MEYFVIAIPVVVPGEAISPLHSCLRQESCIFHIPISLIHNQCKIGDSQSIINKNKNIGLADLHSHFYIGLQLQISYARLPNTSSKLDKRMKKALLSIRNKFIPEMHAEDRVELKKRARPHRGLHRGQLKAMLRWDQMPIVAYK